MTESRDPVSKLHDAAVLWAVGYGSALDVVRAACDALVAGADGPSVAMLAGVSVRQADTELRDLLPAALAELGLPPYAENSEEAEVAALKVLASRALAGDLSARELADWAHRTIGHDRLPLAEPLAALDDQYDMLGHGPVGPGTVAVAALDAEVLTEARRIVESAASDRDSND